MAHEELSCALRRAVIALWRLRVALEAEEQLCPDSREEDTPC